MPTASPAPGGAPVVLRAGDVQAVVFDLDGVLTRTARVHAAAWKHALDPVLAARAGAGAAAFDAEDDYLAHVDGKPRLAGARDFLAARGLVLPEGDPDDAPGNASLWAVCNAKNRAFLARLERDGVETYAPAVALLGRLERCGIRCAVVSASRNCRQVLAAAGLAQHFETVVDGTDAAREGLAGKPAPDMFLAAAARLDVAPAKAAVVEDAEAGVAAAHAGGFARVIGVDRARHAAALRARGATEVVTGLDQVRVCGRPSALETADVLRRRLAGRAPAVLLDYDGTLTAIVARPEDARLAVDVRARLDALATLCTVAVVTGRGLATIRGLVGLEHVIYLSDHGFQAQLPGCAPLRPGPAAAVGARIESLVARLRERLGAVPGLRLEVKRFSVAVHYRGVAPDAAATVCAAVHELVDANGGLRLLAGKKVLEAQPDVDWDKGAAVLWLLDHLALAPEQAVYVGDDVTDESAFRALAGRGSTVAVQQQARPTAAQWRLRDVEEVARFLALLEALAGEARR